MSVRKILNSTTKMSLNDRFTVLRREMPASQSKDNKKDLESRRQSVQASRRNQRLAAQMEKRPAVIAALNLRPSVQNRINGQQKLTVKQRLSLPSQRLQTYDGRQRGFPRGRGGLRGARGGRGFVRGRGQRGSPVSRSFQTQGRLSGLNTPIGRGGRLGRGTIRGRGRRGFSRSFRQNV